MPANRITDHDPLLIAILAGGFVWLVFDGFVFGLLAALMAFVLTDRAQKAKKK